jgi:competence protein ComGC
MGKIKDQLGFSAVEGLLVILVVAVFGFGGYYVWHTQKDNNKSAVTASKSSASKAKTSAEDNQTAPAVDKTQETVTAINELISKGDYLGLSAYMADQVWVIRQSTDYDGSGLSAAAAAGSVAEYLSHANLPWNFGHSDLQAKINASFAGEGKTVAQQVAVSGNNWVAAYHLDNNQKIDSFYQSVSADLIQ